MYLLRGMIVSLTPVYVSVTRHDRIPNTRMYLLRGMIVSLTPVYVSVTRQDRIPNTRLCIYYEARSYP